MELREVKNKGKEVVYYRETDGQWTADFSGLVYMSVFPSLPDARLLPEYSLILLPPVLVVNRDFKPLKITTGNNTVDYTVTYCK
jgi:hypothetical protein